jgi:polar amino acid transport system substrate-binding protein
MKNALKTIALAAAIGIAAVSGAAAQQVRVGFAAEPYPPFTSPDASGNWEGWEVDFMKAICTEAKLDCVITPVAWDGIIPALTSNKIDMIIGSMSITAERLQTIDFSDKYYNTPTAVIGPKGESFEATQDEANNDLAAGRIDAVQADSIALSAFLKSEQGAACCDLKGNVKDDPDILGLGVGVGLRKGETELKEKINAAIKAIRSNGTYDEITKKYFDFDVYGG